ncbi:VOC family protein [Terrimonas rubra]|uniref:VOC family protein n=1 Tax=Terrimonas rubra TaxID=1035890 RepID=A0ABW6A2B7_9BACT
MKKQLFAVVLMTITALTACNNQAGTGSSASTTDSITTKTGNMKNLISIAEIPITDFTRARNFYQTILGLTIEEMDMDGVKMGIFPNEEGTINVVLAKGHDYKPTTDGPVLYLNAGKDLQPVLSKVETAGGKTIVPKTMISPEMGYFALFIDTEGNKLGLHSSH